MTDKKYLTTIPFMGFYESIHNAQIDSALELIFDDDQDLISDYSDLIDFKKIFVLYAQEYLSAFNQEFNLDLKFESLQSPKYYNFSTDRIFAYISESELKKIFKVKKSDLFKEYLKNNFTSYSGFISSYSNDPDQWPDNFQDYDHNQIGALLYVYCELLSAGSTYKMEYIDHYLIENYNMYESITNELLNDSNLTDPARASELLNQNRE